MPLLDEDGVIHRLTKDGPIRRFARGEPLLSNNNFVFQMIPIPPGADPVDFVVRVANGNWARNAAEGWTKRLGLIGTPQGEDFKKRMAIAYAAGATGATPEITIAAQQKLGVKPGPLPTVTTPKVEKKPAKRKTPPKKPQAPPKTIPPPTTREQIIIMQIFQDAERRGASPNIPKSSLIAEAKIKGVRNPEPVINNMIEQGMLESAGRFVRVPKKSR